MAQPKPIPQVEYATAVVTLRQKIVARYGNDPDTIGRLKYGIRPCPHEGGERGGFVLCAYPPEVNGDADRLVDGMLWSYFGDIPEGAEAAREHLG